MDIDTRHPAIDLTRHHFMRPVGDLVVFGTWVYNADEEDHEPALVILPRYRKDGFRPCCVALSALWKYNPEHNGAAYLARVSKLFVQQLGMEDTLSNAYKVAEAIQNHMSDLISMPPNPTSRVIVADASITIDGRRQHIELADHHSMKQY